MPKAKVELVKTGERYVAGPDFWVACGSLDSDQCYISIRFEEPPSEEWVREFDRLKAQTSDYLDRRFQINEIQHSYICFNDYVK